jgi:3-hydroxyisobutyrate dehydrogenase-like beta-hydroxyacid dehydrogenase
MLKKVGFIGLGQMGKWMALNLVTHKFDLKVYDIDENAMAYLVDRGAQPAQSPAELAGTVDLIILSLPDSGVVEKVVCGRDGIVHGASPGQIVVDCGTSGYLWTKEFAKSLQEKGIRFVDAPVTGMEKRAKEGTLTIMFGGDDEILETIRPVLEAMGKEIVHMGNVGNGQLTKMLNNILYNCNIAAMAEVLPMSVKLGLDPEKIARVINNGSGHSFASEAFLPNILQGCFNKSYPLEHAYKDMNHALQISAREKIPLPMVHTAATTYQMALNSGYGREDKGAMVKVFENALGVKFRKKAR